MAKLTSDDVLVLTRDELLGRPPRIRSPDADRFLEEFRKDVEYAKSRGWVVEIPAEIEVGT